MVIITVVVVITGIMAITFVVIFYYLLNMFVCVCVRVEVLRRGSRRRGWVVHIHILQERISVSGSHVVLPRLEPRSFSRSK